MIIGSRKSDLAVIQAQSVAEHLKNQNPNLEIQFFQRPSMGDLNLDMDLNKTNSKGVFTADFVEHLRQKDCDMVVHSWKDLPIEETPEFKILPGPYREDQRDVFFLKQTSLEKSKIRIMTSSPRREFQLQQNLPELLPFKTEIAFESIRGNIPTRFKKFLESPCDGFVVAKAAIDRLLGGSQAQYEEVHRQIHKVFEKCRWMVLPLSQFPTAAAQGALAIELPEDSPYLAQVKKISDSRISECVELERRTHKSFGGGCHQAMGFSALYLEEEDGILFYSSGRDDAGKTFHRRVWKSTRPLPQKFFKSDVFLSSEVQSTRKTLEFEFKETEPSEYIIARFEAFPWKSHKCSEKSVFWAAGVTTWKKLAEKNVWVNGCLDSLGLEHKPEFSFLKSYPKLWFTHKAASENDLGEFKKVETYEVEWSLQKQDLVDKKIFFWSSAELFKKALKLAPDELRSAYHVCGFGRTSKALQAELKDSQIFYMLDEKEFCAQCIETRV